ncbi:MAG: extracellular solute-binding protein [Ignavibacteriales bacterium]|nr:extracellular solute-binding protein [Ignavibacteriales bacterium]
MKNINAVLFLLTILVFTSCKSSKNSQNGLLYWSSNNTDEITYARFIVEKWNKENPGKEVKFQPVPEGQSSEEVILAAVVGGTTPDVYSNMWQGDVEYYARAGKLVALDTLDGFIEFLADRCDSAVIKEVTSRDGHIYQIPWKINPIMMIYNVNFLKEIGMAKPPRTYSEFLSMARTIKEKYQENGRTKKWAGYAEVQVTWWQRWFDYYPLYLSASGGAKLVEGDTAVFDNKYSVATFSFLQKLFTNNYFPTDRLSSGQDPFLSGTIATRFTGPWEIIHAEKFKPSGFTYGFAPIPVPDDHTGQQYTYGDTKNLVIFKTCGNPQLAWYFLREFCKLENEVEFLKMTNQLPRRKDLMTDKLFAKYFKKNPMMIPFALQAPYVIGPDNSPVLKEVFDVISAEYEQCVIYNKKSPESAVKDAAHSANLVLMQ